MEALTTLESSTSTKLPDKDTPCPGKETSGKSSSKAPVPLKLQKLGSGSRRPANLIRDSVSVQDIDERDARLAYAVYKLGKLPENWNPVEGLKPMDFVGALEDFISSNYTHAWSVREKNDPIVIVFGLEVSGFVVAGDVIWHPNATKRQKLEAGARFFKDRKNILVIGVTFDTKKYYERLMDYGFLRRVGTNYQDGERMAQFETRAR